MVHHNAFASVPQGIASNSQQFVFSIRKQFRKGVGVGGGDGDQQGYLLVSEVNRYEQQYCDLAIC
jgi:hypothetical protein